MWRRPGIARHRDRRAIHPEIEPTRLWITVAQARVHRALGLREVAISQRFFAKVERPAHEQVTIRRSRPHERAGWRRHWAHGAEAERALMEEQFIRLAGERLPAAREPLGHASLPHDARQLRIGSLDIAREQVERLIQLLAQRLGVGDVARE